MKIVTPLIVWLAVASCAYGMESSLPSAAVDAHSDMNSVVSSEREVQGGSSAVSGQTVSISGVVRECYEQHPFLTGVGACLLMKPVLEFIWQKSSSKTLSLFGVGSLMGAAVFASRDEQIKSNVLQLLHNRLRYFQPYWQSLKNTHFTL